METNFFNQLMKVVLDNHELTIDAESKLRIQHNIKIIIRGLQDNRTIQLDEMTSRELIVCLAGCSEYIEESWVLAAKFEKKLWDQETINLNLNRTIKDLRNKISVLEMQDRV